jgi:4-hydroxybenzoate polyprenyltransferase
MHVIYVGGGARMCKLSILKSKFWQHAIVIVYISYTNSFQDKEDDIKAGVKSTALLFGDMTKSIISAFGVACIGGFALSGYNAHLGSCSATLIYFFLQCILYNNTYTCFYII